MEGEQSRGDGAPNAVLRGGAFDGECVHVTSAVPVVRFAGKVRHVYRPTADLDDEYPAMVVYAYERTLIY